MKNITPQVKNILEWVYCFLIALILAILVRYFLGTPTIVKQPSMYPTLQEGQRLLLNRWVRTVKGEYKRGDIITFEAPSVNYVSAYDVDLNNPVAEYNRKFNGWFSKFFYYFIESNKTSYIKRVIATEGEHVKIENGKVYINGEELEEKYLKEGITTESLGGAFIDLDVPNDCVFVLGDNRSQSTDSRRFGCIPIKKIESKVLIRFWPFNLFGKVD